MSEKPNLLALKDGKVTVKLSELEAEVLISVLNFAKLAAVVVKNLESERKSDPKDVKRMESVAADAGALITILTNQYSVAPEADKPEYLN
jgi:hypothetical protein